MTPRPPASCLHDLRPGTKVCLHCRRAEREAASARQRALLVRLGVSAAAVGAVAFAGAAGLAAWKDSSGSGLGRLVGSPASLEAAPAGSPTQPQAPAAGITGAAPSGAVAPVSTTHDAVRAVAAPAAADSAKADLASSVAGTPAATPPVVTAPPAAQPAPVTPPAAAQLQPIIAEGRTELQNGIYALRRGDTVTVHFDTPEARTRRPEKFEQIVRTTLPQVHGRAADSLLAGIAAANLLPAADLAAQALPPIALRGPHGQALSLAPQTRPGRDGPLVVAYRITPAR